MASSARLSNGQPIVSLPWLVGESPSKSGDRFFAFPLSGRPAKTMCEAAGIPPHDDGTYWGRWTWALYERFMCRNVFERWADADPWSTVRAREQATRFILEDAPNVVVCLGRKTATAFGLSWDYGEWCEAGLLQIVLAPHPSGRNRQMNTAGGHELLGRILNEAIQRATVVEAS
jgi:hypothetical protein